MSRLARLATIIRIIGHYRLDELVDSERLPTLDRKSVV